MGTTNNGAIAPPIWLAISKTPDMLARCVGGNQRETTIDPFGKAPASPAPKQNRVIKRTERFHARPVSDVNADHHSTTRVSTRRGPIRSTKAPVGISNRQ